MTREEAIEQIIWFFEYDNGLFADKKTIEAYQTLKNIQLADGDRAISLNAVKGVLESVSGELFISKYKTIKAIYELPFVTPQQKWIPCSERLPKAGEYIEDVAKYYLVQNEYGDMLVARYTHGEYWEQIYQSKPIGDEIVAWMPLPKPYEPQDKCKNCKYYRNSDYTCHKCKAERNE